MRLLIFKATEELGRVEWDWGKSKCQKTHCPYHDLAIFLELTLFRNYCKPLVNFQSSEKVAFDDIWQCPYCFYEGLHCFYVLTQQFQNCFPTCLHFNLNKFMSSKFVIMA